MPFARTNNHFHPRVLITSGPTHEPIDAVRYIGNRSSGRLGSAIAQAAAKRNWPTTILHGNQSSIPNNPEITCIPFQTTADLQHLLRRELPECDVLIMAAAVADYRPRQPSPGSKLRRTGESLTLELEPTPDLLKDLATIREPKHLFVGFALEPEKSLITSARFKLDRKNLDLIIANPLETMDSDTIRPTALLPNDSPLKSCPQPDKPMLKTDFANWLLDLVTQLDAARKADAAHE